MIESAKNSGHYQINHMMTMNRVFPDEWYKLHEKHPTEPHREKVTLRLDADMLKWYRGLGRGWQPRINAILRAYMRAILSKEIERIGDRSVNGRPL